MSTAAPCSTTWIQRSDYLGIGLIPMREQVENYNIVSFPLPDWMQPEADRYGDYISALYFPERYPAAEGSQGVYHVSGTVLRSGFGV